MRDVLPVPDVPAPMTDNILQATPHGASLAALVATIGGWLPAIVAIIPAIYYTILIWESSTVQHWLRNMRMRHQARKLLRLKAKAKIAQAKLDAEELVRAARTKAKETVKIAVAEAARDKAVNEVKVEASIPPVTPVPK